MYVLIDVAFNRDINGVLRSMAARFCLVLSASLWSVSADRLTVQYRVLEEQRPHTVIGNVASDVGLDVLTSPRLHYHLVAVVWNQPLSDNDGEQSYFTLDADNAQLTTSKVISQFHFFST